MQSNKTFKFLKEKDSSTEERFKNNKLPVCLDNYVNQMSIRSAIYQPSILKFDSIGYFTETLETITLENNNRQLFSEENSSIKKFSESTASKTLFDNSKSLKIKAKFVKKKEKKKNVNKIDLIEEFDSDFENFYNTVDLTNSQKTENIKVVFAKTYVSEIRVSKFEKKIGLKDYIEKMRNRNRNFKQYNCQFCDRILYSCASLGGHQYKHHPGKKKSDPGHIKVRHES